MAPRPTVLPPLDGDGCRAESVAAFRGAVRTWVEQGEDFEAAADALVAVVLLGADDPALAEMAANARAVLERVGARPCLARLDAAIGGAPDLRATGSSATPADTPVATGRTGLGCQPDDTAAVGAASGGLRPEPPHSLDQPGGIR